MIAMLDPGTPLLLVELTRSWALVAAANGWRGWVAAAAILPWG